MFCVVCLIKDLGFQRLRQNKPLWTLYYMCHSNIFCKTEKIRQVIDVNGYYCDQHNHLIETSVFTDTFCLHFRKENIRI